MGRRKKHETALAAVAFGAVCVLALCCGGPISFFGSTTTKQRPAANQSRSERPTQRSLNRDQARPKPSVAQRRPPEQPTTATAPAAFEVSPPEQFRTAVVDAPAPAEPVESAPSQDEAQPPPGIYRKWTDDTGMFTVVAVVARWNSQTAKLQREDGKLLVLPLEKLSATDLEYLKMLKTPPTLLPGGKVLIGKVVGVTDGDTIKLMDEDRGHYTIRLEGIDAPEAHQAFGNKAKQTLSDKVFGETVRVEWKETDKHKRTLGHLYRGTRHINRELVTDGFAWHYKDRSSDQGLATAEIEAREQIRGLWRDSNPVAPWEFRKGYGEDAVASGPFALPTSKDSLPVPVPAFEPSALTVYVTQTGSHYHLGGCRHLSKSRIPISLDRAKAGYSPCAVCRPP
jgi:endonuclease YncB( thermonuclease family)